MSVQRHQDYCIASDHLPITLTIKVKKVGVERGKKKRKRRRKRKVEQFRWKWDSDKEEQYIKELATGEPNKIIQYIINKHGTTDSSSLINILKEAVHMAASNVNMTRVAVTNINNTGNKGGDATRASWYDTNGKK